MIQGKLTTRDNFQRKRMPNYILSINRRVLRKESSESPPQIFPTVQSLISVGQSFSVLFGLSWCFPRSYEDFLLQILFALILKNQARVLWINAVSAALWHLWLESKENIHWAAVEHWKFLGSYKVHSSILSLSDFFFFFSFVIFLHILVSWGAFLYPLALWGYLICIRLFDWILFLCCFKKWRKNQQTILSLPRLDTIIR